MRTLRVAPAAVASWLALVMAAAAVVPAALHADSDAWSQFHGDARHTGLASVNGPQLFALAWYAAAGGDVDTGPVAGADGTVYFSAADGTVHALSPDGGQKWVYTARTPIYASPVLAPDGRVLIGDAGGRMRALDPADGSIAWTLGGLGSVRGTAAEERMAPPVRTCQRTDPDGSMAVKVPFSAPA